MYYVEPYYMAALDKNKAGCPMHLSGYYTDTGEPQTHCYQDLTGVVNCDNYARKTGSSHTEVALCSDIIREAIETGTDVDNTKVPRGYEIHSTLPPCDEHCLRYYQDGTFLRHNWQVEKFLNHANAKRQQSAGRAQHHLSPDPDRWQNYNWLVIFSGQYSAQPERSFDPLPCYAVCTKMLQYFNNTHPKFPYMKKRWMTAGWVNGLVPLTSNMEDIRGWTHLFFDEIVYKGNCFKGLDDLTQEYVYWFLTGKQSGYNTTPPPKVGNLYATLTAQFNLLHDPIALMLHNLPQHQWPAHILTMMATLSELFSRCVSQQTLANIPDPTSLPASEAAITPARSAKKRGRSSSPSEEEQSSAASQQSSSAKRSKSQESPSTTAYQDTMPMVYALIQSAWTMAGQAARLQREEQRQTSLTQLQANISQFFAQRHLATSTVIPAAVPGSSTQGSSSASSSSSSSSNPVPSSTLVSGSGLHQPQVDNPEPRALSSSSAVSDLHPSLPNAPENIRLCIRRRSESDDAESETSASEHPSQRHTSARASSSAPAQRRRIMRATRDDDESLDEDLFNTAVPAETRVAVQGIRHRVSRSTQRAGNASRVERPARERAVVTADGQLALLPPGSDSETEIVSDSDTETYHVVPPRQRGGNNTRHQAARRR